MLALALAAALAAAPEGGAPRVAVAPGPPPLRQEEWNLPPDDDDERRSRIRFTAWVGEAFDAGGSGHDSAVFGGEAGWAFDALDLGVSGAGYRDLGRATREWTPVVLARITQRFRTHRGVEAAFGFGIGAGQPRGWTAWYQLAIGVRVPLGPLFLAGELAFEQYELLRLAGGLGVAF